MTDGPIDIDVNIYNQKIELLSVLLNEIRFASLLGLLNVQKNTDEKFQNSLLSGSRVR